MEDSGLAAIAKFTMRDRQYLGCLRVREGLLTLEQMHFADEVRPVEEVRPEPVKVEKRELEMAEQLIASFSGEFDPTSYRDTYRDALCEIINAKREGKEVHLAPPEEREETTDLMAALRASIAAAEGRRPASSGPDGELDELTKEELYERAKRADVPGRSQMSREELIDALRAA
jgi:DNA end-binding protein Ku